jgi:hypothetical protein
MASLVLLLPIAAMLITLFTSILALWKWRSFWKIVGILLLVPLAGLLLVTHDLFVEPPSWDTMGLPAGVFILSVFLGLCSSVLLAIHALVTRRRKL